MDHFGGLYEVPMAARKKREIRILNFMEVLVLLLC
jgi:hypothetical protein